MSAKNRGSVTISQEFYPTPEPAIDAIFAEIDWSKVDSFTEPCRGNGAIYDKVPLPSHNKHWCELTEGKDYLNTMMPRVDLVLTNPPFSLAREFIEKAITESDCVVMLQRLNFLGSKARKEFWNKNQPSHIFVLSSRPKFIGKCNKCKASHQLITKVCECGGKVNAQSDSTEYCWYVFSMGDGEKIIKKPRGVYVI